MRRGAGLRCNLPCWPIGFVPRSPPGRAATRSRSTDGERPKARASAATSIAVHAVMTPPMRRHEPRNRTAASPAPLRASHPDVRSPPPPFRSPGHAMDAASIHAELPDDDRGARVGPGARAERSPRGADGRGRRALPHRRGRGGRARGGGGRGRPRRDGAGRPRHGAGGRRAAAGGRRAARASRGPTRPPGSAPSASRSARTRGCGSAASRAPCRARTAPISCASSRTGWSRRGLWRRGSSSRADARSSRGWPRASGSAGRDDDANSARAPDLRRRPSALLFKQPTSEQRRGQAGASSRSSQTPKSRTAASGRPASGVTSRWARPIRTVAPNGQTRRPASRASRTGASTAR